MADLFDYIPHPRMHTRQVEGPPKVAAAAAQLHGQSAVAKLNAKVGLKITLIVGTVRSGPVLDRTEELRLVRERGDRLVDKARR